MVLDKETDGAVIYSLSGIRKAQYELNIGKRPLDDIIEYTFSIYTFWFHSVWEKYWL